MCKMWRGITFASFYRVNPDGIGLNTSACILQTLPLCRLYFVCLFGFCFCFVFCMYLLTSNCWKVFINGNSARITGKLWHLLSSKFLTIVKIQWLYYWLLMILRSPGETVTSLCKYITTRDWTTPFEWVLITFCLVYLATLMSVMTTFD